MNTVVLKGWIQNPPKALANVSANVSVLTVKTAQGKDKEGKTSYTYHNVKSFKTLQNCNQGDLVTVLGHLASGKYEKDGKTIYTYELIGDDIFITPNQAQPQPNPQGQGYGYPQGQPQPMQQPNPQGQGYGYPQGQPMQQPQQPQQAQQMQQYPTQSPTQRF